MIARAKHKSVSSSWPGGVRPGCVLQTVHAFRSEMLAALVQRVPWPEQIALILHDCEDFGFYK